MSPYSTPSLWRASVAGPVKGGVVASWRNTSRNVFSSAVNSLMFTAPVVLPVRSRPPAEPLAESSSSRTELRLQPRTCNPAVFLLRRRPERRPTLLPGPRSASPRLLRGVPARSFLVEIRPVADMKGSPSPPALCTALALQPCTIRRANHLLSDDSSGILRLGASPGPEGGEIRVARLSDAVSLLSQAIHLAPSCQSHSGSAIPPAPALQGVG